MNLFLFRSKYCTHFIFSVWFCTILCVLLLIFFLKFCIYLLLWTEDSNQIQNMCNRSGGSNECSSQLQSCNGFTLKCRKKITSKHAHTLQVGIKTENEGKFKEIWGSTKPKVFEQTQKKQQKLIKLNSSTCEFVCWLSFRLEVKTKSYFEHLCIGCAILYACMCVFAKTGTR